RRQQIIETAIAAGLGDIETNGKEIACLIEKKAEIHSRQFLTSLSQLLEFENALARPRAGFPQRFSVWPNMPGAGRLGALGDLSERGDPMIEKRIIRSDGRFLLEPRSEKD